MQAGTLPQSQRPGALRELLQEQFPGGEGLRDILDFIAFQVRPRGGGRYRIPQAPQAVDQPLVQGVGSAPDAPLGQAVDLLRSHIAPLGHQLYKLPVAEGHPAGQGLRYLRIEGPVQPQ